MAKFTLHVSIGLTKEEEVIEVSDEELEGMSEQGVNELLEGHLQIFASDRVDMCFWRNDD